MTSGLNHVWKPSTARVIVIDAFVPVPRGTNAAAPAPLSWPVKDPRDVLDYQLDIGPAVSGNETDSIADSAVTIVPNDPGDLVLTSLASDGTAMVLWLAGGQPGKVYTVTVLINTTNGRAIQRSVLLPVLDLSVPAVPANAIQTSAGLVLTDQNGNPVLASP